MGEVWCSHYVIYWGIVVVDESLRRFSLAPKMRTAVPSTGAGRKEILTKVVRRMECSR